MENLTEAEKMRLMVILRLRFDLPTTELDECKDIISIAKKLEIPSFFVVELENDFKTGH